MRLNFEFRRTKSLLKRLLRLWKKYFWNHLVRFNAFLDRKSEFYNWKLSPSQASKEEIEVYEKFIACLGGWKNITGFVAKSKSWHFQLVHEFLVDWEKLNKFDVKILSYDWPILELVSYSYSKWIVKRLRKHTHMPSWVFKRKLRKTTG
ncbi:hypothetical protein MHLP_00155 [Candidatus Mycoplasma haematolamae str. Purdue]|uniref:Uncharacterized protein n=1 Tax=Mycoplasma haematolamae (strain Purdue) TaxID=1212765 RepID=I7CEF1_MYCHA|nr:hypothetical protein [Candidatus Mycoplasma haematolamae]AFO51611.1 hypothetical protein MHLP_00155 [Candidatus Mycoplasma haematolamae str. Purdue]